MRKDAVEAHARCELARQGGEVSNARRARSTWGSGRRFSLSAALCVDTFRLDKSECTDPY